mgnify:CR=1 FL=1
MLVGVVTLYAASYYNAQDNGGALSEVASQLFGVAVGAAEIAAGDITDKRKMIAEAFSDKAAMVSQVTTTLETEFRAWFAGLEEVLDENTSGDLASQIVAVNGRVTTLDNTVNGLSENVTNLTNAVDAQSSASAIKIASWQWGEQDQCAPQLLMTADNLNSRFQQNIGRTPNENDVLLLLLRLTYAASSQIIPVFLLQGGSAVAYCYNNGAPYTREVRWQTAASVTTYRKDTFKVGSKKYTVTKTKDFGAGLYISWTRSGTKATTQGDYYQEYVTADHSKLTAAKCQSMNSSNTTKNFTYNTKILPVGLYILRGADTVAAE